MPEELVWHRRALLGGQSGERELEQRWPASFEQTAGDGRSRTTLEVIKSYLPASQPFSISPLTLCVVKAVHIVHSTDPTGVEILGVGDSLCVLPFEERPWLSDSIPDNSIHLIANNSSGMAVIYGSISF